MHVYCRQELAEEKVRKSVTPPHRTLSMPGGRAGLAASLAAGSPAAAGGEGSAGARPWLRSQNSAPAKKW